MKKVKFLLLTLSIIFASCSSDDDTSPIVEETAEFTVKELSLNQGLTGADVTITGTGFPTTAKDVKVTFNTVEAVIKSINSTVIIVAVPDNAKTGDVTVTYDSKVLNVGVFTVLDPLIQNTIENLHAPQTGGQGQPVGGPFTKFDFETGKETTSETDWDVAFRGTTIIVNGGVVSGTADEPTRNGDVGVAIATGVFNSITTAEGLNFSQDADGALAITTGSGNGWYNYSGPPSHLITPIPGKVLVFKTRNGNYAKIEILSYYKDAPANPNVMTDASRYFTFKYVYNPNTGVKNFE